jgi:predicted nucleic acid-binding protein
VALRSRRAIAVAGIPRYSSLRLELTDASIAVPADRDGAKDIPTLDERHFRVVRTSDHRQFRLLPVDG